MIVAQVTRTCFDGVDWRADIVRKTDKVYDVVAYVTAIVLLYLQAVVGEKGTEAVDVECLGRGARLLRVEKGRSGTREVARKARAGSQGTFRL